MVKGASLYAEVHLPACKKEKAPVIIALKECSMQDILKNIQVHVPFHFLHDRFLPKVIKEGINPEISFNHYALDHFKKDDYRKVADQLLGAGLTITFHAPFMDLRPGAIDPRVRQVTTERLNQAFDLVPLFRPRTVVCHASFDKRYYVSNEKRWLENSIETWKHFLTRAVEMNTVVALENVYESDYQHLALLLDAFASPHICFCFDTGHFNVFSVTPMEEWMNGLGARIGQVHIHDNNGLSDEHLPVGEGSFPFQKFFGLLREKGRQPIVTVESHTEKHLWRMLENIRAIRLFGE
jgi:sugar phosphate isomerase/epimerase